MIRAVLDANIFFSVWVTDPLLSFADADFFEPVWSTAIMAEVRRHLPHVWSRSTPARVNRYIDMLDAAFPQASSDFSTRVETAVRLPDPDDRHVVAVAVAACARYIVTWNLSDFPQRDIRDWNIRAISPDDFLCLLAESDREEAEVIMRRLVLSKRHPPRSMDEEIRQLASRGLTRFAQWLSENQ